MTEQSMVALAIELPRGNRDDLGVTGEALHQLSEWLIENRCSLQVRLGATLLEKWDVLNNFIQQLPDPNAFYEQHKYALYHLRRQALADQLLKHAGADQ